MASSRASRWTNQTNTHYPWKGQVRDYGLMVDGDFVEDAASNIKDHVAFYPGKVEVRDQDACGTGVSPAP